jgi:hypothetical protein
MNSELHGWHMATVVLLQPAVEDVMKASLAAAAACSLSSWCYPEVSL